MTVGKLPSNVTLNECGNTVTGPVADTTWSYQNEDQDRHRRWKSITLVIHRRSSQSDHQNPLLQRIRGRRICIFRDNWTDHSSPDCKYEQNRYELVLCWTVLGNIVEESKESKRIKKEVEDFLTGDTEREANDRKRLQLFDLETCIQTSPNVPDLSDKSWVGQDPADKKINVTVPSYPRKWRFWWSYWKGTCSSRYRKDQTPRDDLFESRRLRSLQESSLIRSTEIETQVQSGSMHWSQKKTGSRRNTDHAERTKGFRQKKDSLNKEDLFGWTRSLKALLPEVKWKAIHYIESHRKNWIKYEL